jgi:hypothetical protein
MSYRNYIVIQCQQPIRTIIGPAVHLTTIYTCITRKMMTAIQLFAYWASFGRGTWTQNHTLEIQLNISSQESVTSPHPMRMNGETYCTSVTCLQKKSLSGKRTKSKMVYTHTLPPIAPHTHTHTCTHSERTVKTRADTLQNKKHGLTPIGHYTHTHTCTPSGC